MRKTDEHGFEYYDQLPSDFRLASMEDFEKGFMNHGRSILVLSSTDERYECYQVNNPLSDNLRLFTNLGRLFVQDPVL
ncbi:MAG TPA: hypothetical protein PKH94_07390 [Bacteroidales bacterium]|nr:hypothetical protein [Bacteroidales bacterium]